jgi:cell division septal protein FtsQ
MKRNKRKIPLKLISAAFIILLALVLLIGYTWKFCKSSDSFKVREVLVKEGIFTDFSYLLGRNVFSIDLERESRKILALFPECKNVRLVRLLPNRLYVDLLKRKALAIVKLHKDFVVDEYRVLFDMASVEQPHGANLPLITGLETKILGPKSGKRCDIKELEAAISIIKETQRNRVLRDYRIRKIEAANATNLSVFIIPGSADFDVMDSTLRNDGIEVRMSSDRIRNKVAMLANVLTAARNEWNNIKYVDFRFKEPVIRLKDAK